MEINGTSAATLIVSSSPVEDEAENKRFSWTYVTKILSFKE